MIQADYTKDIIAKAKLLGLPIKEIPTYCKHKCYLISVSDTQHVACIPDDVIEIDTLNQHEFRDSIKDLQGALKVVGGKNLKGAVQLFYKCPAKSLDLSNFDTSNVIDMRWMFDECQAKSLDLSSFNTSNVTDMCGMFCKCKAQYLDISTFDTSKVTDMHGMFCECQAQSLDLSNFNTSNATDMGYMFYGFQAKYLDLSSFDTSHVTDMDSMFYECKAQSIDLISFDASKVTNTNNMFDGCNTKIKATDTKILKAYKNRMKSTEEE